MRAPAALPSLGTHTDRRLFRCSGVFCSPCRPITEAALGEPSGAPAWKSVPSWHIYGDADRNIPPAAMKFMADRAGAKETVVLQGASHVPQVSQPKAVAAIIRRAAAGSGL